MNKEAFMQTAEALGSTIELRVIAANQTEAEHLFMQLWKEISEFEQQFSRFIGESELSRFNEKAGEVVPLSPEFEDILRCAQAYASRSEGWYNPFILPSLAQAGYVHSMTDPRQKGPDFSAHRIVDPNMLTIMNHTAHIPEGSALDLGGIGKGYLADRLAELADATLEDYCLSLGGDMRVRGRDVDGPWRIDVQSARDRDRDIAEVTCAHNTFGVATSGTMRRKRSAPQSHLINPKTGRALPPSARIATVVADSATTADVMASSILLAGEAYVTRMVEQKIIHAVLLQDGVSSASILLGDEIHLNEYSADHP